MNTRSPSCWRAVPIRVSSSSGVAEVYRSGSGDWSRNMGTPKGWRSDWRTVRTARSPSTGLSSSERICRRIPGRRETTVARNARFAVAAVYRSRVRRAEFERWSTVIGGFAVAGAFYHYVLFAVGARTANGKFEASILNVVHRTED